ncbi:MAG: hypothetical protein QF718_07590 [Phycisphaerales bacterium]|nr:hypothetical protein [Phycisphaerales bacterium]
MTNTRFLVPLLVFAFCFSAVAQPRTITRIVGNNSIDDRDADMIRRYATGWAENLQTTDSEELSIAHNKLVEPLRPEHGMSPYARSIYGKELKNSFKPILASENQMAAINALQVMSFLGTEQACGVLLSHADLSTEDKPSLRLWASIGLGTSFQVGILQPSRISDYATILSNFILKESEWHIIARQFESLASLYDIPDLSSRELENLESLSMKLQVNSMSKLLDNIMKSEEVDERVKSLPFALPSLRLQLIEPSITEEVREEGQKVLLPVLIDFVEFSITRTANSGDDKGLHKAYGESINTAGLIIDRILGVDDGGLPMAEPWETGDLGAIGERVALWKKLSKN